MEFFNRWAPWFINKLMEDFNINLLSSVAIVGNAGHESGGFKSLQEKKPLIPGSRGGYGIMQWTGPRRREYEAYCSRNDLNPADMETNYKFLFVELSGPEGRVLKKLQSVETLEEKVKVFSDVFLRPGIPHMDSRQVWAKRALSAWEKSQDGKSIPETPEAPVDPVSVPKKGIWDLILEIIKLIVEALNVGSRK